MDAQHAQTISALADDRLRVLHLQVTSPAGEPLALHVPWDRTPRDLAHALVAGTDLETPDRTVRAFSADHDLLDVPLREAVRHEGNPDGAVAVVLQVEGPFSTFEGVLSCSGLAETEPHRAYPHPLDSVTERRLGAFLSSDGPDWFCDASSERDCCAATRAAPSEQTWVAV